MMALEKQLAAALIDYLGQVLRLCGAEEEALSAAGTRSVDNRKSRGKTIRTDVGLGDDELGLLVCCQG
jgi:hypothetical protein